MPEPYTYHIDISRYDGKWRTVIIDQTRSTLNTRDPKSVARATLESWIVDNPDQCGGAARVRVYGADPSEYPPDTTTHVRVWVFRGSPDAHEQLPAAAAYLVDVPDE